MLIPAADRGAANEASIPVKEKSKGPSTLKHRHPFSQRIFAGISSCEQTMESSESVRVQEKKLLLSAHCGNRASLSSLQIASVSFIIDSFCGCILRYLPTFCVAEEFLVD